MLFPVRYYDRRVAIDWDSAETGDIVAVEAALCGKPSVARIRRGLTLVRAKFDAGGRQIGCAWFNQEYICKSLAEGQTRLLIGKIKRYKTSIELTAPQMYAPQPQDVTPIYRLPKGIPQNVVGEACRAVLGSVGIRGFLTEEIAAKFGLLPLDAALKSIHFPVDVPSAEKARDSVALEQLACILAMYSLVKESDKKRTVFYADKRAELDEAVRSLPFSLTAGQSLALGSIISELMSDRRMNVLLQGDVGSGKTIVAFLAAYFVALNGCQCALMSPTDILAKQHYVNAIDFFESRGVRVAHLSGGQSKGERETALFNIKNGAAQIIVGTQAVISKNTEFYNLALSIVDEQHRFGVCQRGSLENKAAGTDNLVMSATPIPRTLAMTVYGELKQITISERPTGKSMIKTAAVPAEKLAGMYAYIIKKAEAGEKTYIVCPRVSADDSVSAAGLYDELRKGALRPLKLGLLHGQMKESEKSAVLSGFASGDISVLVSTTVVEVGIDVKDATTMVIFGGDRLGLSQLHQLRGRVGRDGRESYCFLVMDGAMLNDRLKLLCECDDGFRLAEYDFSVRGAGDFLGTRQHGDAAAVSGIKVDAEMIKKAKAIADALLSNNTAAAALKEKAETGSDFIKELTLS